MITFLSKIFIRDAKQYRNPEVHRMYGIVCSIFGIFLNVVLFVTKLLAGLATGSVAIMADAFNNLSDAGSSLITLVGFHFAGMQPDKEHPFGHGRIEYIAGFLVAVFIILMGAELVQGSVRKILHPEQIAVSRTAVFILLISIAVKLYMAYYNYQIGKKIDSAAMRATAADSLSDAVATTVVLIAMVVMAVTDINIDGFCGIVVSAFVLFAGYRAAKETISPLLGSKPDPGFIHKIYEIVMAHDMIVGIHDVIVHDYGPGRIMISLHAEVPGKEDVFLLHDLIDTIEAELDTELHCESVIHMDPVESDNDAVMAMKEKVEELVTEIDACISIHDFRMVKADTHTNLIFDVLIPQEFYMTEAEIKTEIQKRIWEKYPRHHTVIKVNKAYV